MKLIHSAMPHISSCSSVQSFAVPLTSDITLLLAPLRLADVSERYFRT